MDQPLHLWSSSFFPPGTERYRKHVKEMLTKIICSAEAEMSLDLEPRPMQKKTPPRLSSQPLRGHLEPSWHHTTNAKQWKNDILCAFCDMNKFGSLKCQTWQFRKLQQGLSVMPRAELLWFGWYFRTSNWGDGRYCTTVQLFTHNLNSWSSDNRWFAYTSVENFNNLVFVNPVRASISLQYHMFESPRKVGTSRSPITPEAGRSGRSSQWYQFERKVMEQDQSFRRAMQICTFLSWEGAYSAWLGWSFFPVPWFGPMSTQAHWELSP